MQLFVPFLRVCVCVCVKEPVILSVDPDMEVPIGEVARLIKDAVGFQGKLVFDTSKADGQFKKTADNAKLKRLLKTTEGAAFDFIPINEGIRNAATWFRDHFDEARK